jgi:uncharacterized RDD family membrane protein YckC
MTSAELKIQTPEGVVFSFRLAGPVSRFLAWTVDLACVTGAASLLASVLGIAGLISLDVSRALSLLAYFGMSIGYGLATEWFWRGQTVGKRLLRLRVMDEHGLRLQFSQIVIRNLLRFVDMLPAFYLVGGLACFFSKRGQRLGDFAANTIVVRNPRLAEPDLDQLTLGKFNSLRQFPHLEARLRQLVSPSEARVVLQSVLRRDDFDAEARVELFGEVTAHLKSLVNFPPEATEALSDEQYIRNVVDVLFRPRRGERTASSSP